VSSLIQRILNSFLQQDEGQQRPYLDAEQGGHELQTCSGRPALTVNTATSEREDETPKQEVLRLSLCVDDGRAKPKLEQEVLQNSNDDRELFT
jgi:5-hydroxyisourate hydrolase-like protein (transthyretin family)